MPKQKHPQVVTANDLFEGDVIYLTRDGAWTRAHGEAAVAHDAEEAERLLALGAAQRGQIVGAYLADAVAGENGPEPTHFREEFRRTGPSNYAHGKQETQSQPRA